MKKSKDLVVISGHYDGEVREITFHGKKVRQTWDIESFSWIMKKKSKYD
jgi:hypothetical protein